MSDMDKKPERFITGEPGRVCNAHDPASVMYALETISAQLDYLIELNISRIDTKRSHEDER